MSGREPRLLFTRRAEKELRRLDRSTQERVARALNRLLTKDRSLDVRRLAGSDLARVRVGEWRVIVETVGDDGTVLVHHVLPRGRAYDR
ncbi:MAG TPA: type II toxin-antitoxin system RelE/ParE family toxin [Conexibacter sp.]|nr:type II toxin-antitoxin system RelE/ParE family toxin [Conexibacter sp.]